MSTIVILDFGSQYTQLLAKRIRQLSTYCEVLPWDVSWETLRSLSPLGIIFSGGPHSVFHENSPKVPWEIYESSIPILGICYGMQLISKDFGSEVYQGNREFGYTPITLMASELFQDIVLEEKDFVTEIRMSHSDYVARIPENFKLIASTPTCPIAAIEHMQKKIFCVQFHPEVSDTTPVGEKILKTFVQRICQAPSTWNPQAIQERLIRDIQEKVGENERVLLGLSGGVDSTITAALLHKALGERVICVLVDTGFLRENEVEEIASQCAFLKENLLIENASELFYSKLKGIHDPEEKRKLLGQTFIEVFESIAKNLDIHWLAQGTIYSDVIESAHSGSSSQVIKSHHNVGGLPEHLHLKLLEPLRYLFKDEVRALGRSLSLSSQLIDRHPFPGPGLAIRVLGEVLPEYLPILRKADKIFLEELDSQGLLTSINQAFAVFLPVKSVAVKGDCRSYGYTIALRAIESTDFMTCRWAHLPYEFLHRCSSRIINEIPEVSRVVYDISDKPPATIEWE
ncbi:GMP synthase [Chlamydia pecorum]|uniref:GMP synthase [glutamine-hydrolyzing] n=1 Tax=Chlamydia pecorum TaxID=85991 RepID=A0AA40PQN4_9CHLA|nr:glutamine-hydrolyzing GMP synthase [Chlamydia pecorum]KTF28772.1 GMP synthase [Chlamydia pecorum]